LTTLGCDCEFSKGEYLPVGGAAGRPAEDCFGVGSGTADGCGVTVVGGSEARGATGECCGG
jgi:hypothetical protein